MPSTSNGGQSSRYGDHPPMQAPRTDSSVSQQQAYSSNASQYFESIPTTGIPQQMMSAVPQADISLAGQHLAGQAPPGQGQSWQEFQGQVCLPNSRHPNAIRIPLTLEHMSIQRFHRMTSSLKTAISCRRNLGRTNILYGGITRGAQYALPCNQDIDVIDHVLLADTYSRSTQLNSPTTAIGSVSVLNCDVAVGASRIIIKRKTNDGSRSTVSRESVSGHE